MAFEEVAFAGAVVVVVVVAYNNHRLRHKSVAVVLVAKKRLKIEQHATKCVLILKIDYQF